MGLLKTAHEVADGFATDERLSGWRVLGTADDALEVEGEVNIVFAWPTMWTDAARLTPHLGRARRGGCAVVVCGTDAEFEEARVDRLEDIADVHIAAVPMSAARLAAVVRSCVVACQRRAEREELGSNLGRVSYENELLVDIGRRLSRERDLNSLLSIILSRAREVTVADAGSIYVVEGVSDDVTERTIRFKVAQNDSVSVPSAGFSMPVSSSSIAGACVISGEVINIDDLYSLDPPGQGNNPWGFVHDRTFDLKYGYQTRSMVTLPMIDAREHVIGVIQLINKRPAGVERVESAEAFSRSVIPFDNESTEFANALAAQAGIALENTLLYDEVRKLFEGFVHASVTAIESRDPTTSGHSRRVAELTVGLAKAADHVSSGPYREVGFGHDELRQIEFAALLHDFGKVGVRENVLVKAKKLYAHERSVIHNRFKYIRKAMEADAYKAKLGYLLESTRDQVVEELSAIDREVDSKVREVDEFLKFILEANEPTVLDSGGFERIAEIAARQYVDVDGSEQSYLSTEEAAALQILRGSLTEHERREIESHVVHTFNFLREIPWGSGFRRIPEIAGAHHEKLDGSGYPRGLTGDQIPVPAKMMTISDIFDALTASDRPYKKAVPLDRALAILQSEVDRGKLDVDLFELFVDANIYTLVM